MPGLASIHAGAQDARQRTTLTIVQDALAQLPAQTSEDLYGEMSDIAGSAPESVELLAGMLVPASEGQNALVEYALNGIVNFACANGNEAYAAPVRAGLAAGLEKCGDTANKALLLSLFRLLATADDILIFLEYAGDPTLGSVAVNALISIEGSDEAIMDLIKSDGASRPLLAYAAAEKGLAAAEPYLLAWIQDLDGNADEDSDPSSKVDTPDMRTYLHALACCGSEASLNFLKKASIYDYITLLQRLAENGNASAAISGARKLLKSDDTNIRCAALEILVSVQGALAGKYILAAAKSPDREYRCAALEYGARFIEDDCLCAGLSKLLETADDGVKTDIVNWTGAHKVSRLLPDVLAYIPEYAGENAGKTASPELVIAAVGAAGMIGGDKAADALVAQLSGDADYAQAAYRALLSFDGDLESRLQSVLEGSDSQAVGYALSLASVRRMTGLAPQVFSLLDSDDSMVRKTAYMTLEGVVAPEDCGRLGSLLEKADTDFKVAALQSALAGALMTLAPEQQYEEAMALIGESGKPYLYYPVLAQSATKDAVKYLKGAYAEGVGAQEAFSALMTVDNIAAADVLMSIAGSDPENAGAALARVVDLVSASGLDDMSRESWYAAVMKSGPDVKLQNKVLDALATTPVMPAFLLAAKYLDDPQTAYRAANAVKSIASRTADEIDYYALKPALEKSMEVFAAAGGADDGYAVDEIRKMLSGLQPPAEKFVLPEDEARAGYEVLFDGTDLSKWTGDMEGYTPVNGTIYVTAKYGDTRNLYTKKEYRDFILRFDFCFVKPGVNNGVGIRTPMGKDAAYWGMCECQILDHDDPIYKNLHEYQVHGSAYGIIPAKRIVHKPLGEWNSEEIKVVGDRITVTLNGEVILDGNLREACQGHNVAPDGSKYNPYTVDHKNHPGMFNEKGHVGFLGHGAGIKFRNVRILDLSE